MIYTYMIYDIYIKKDQGPGSHSDNLYWKRLRRCTAAPCFLAPCAGNPSRRCLPRFWPHYWSCVAETAVCSFIWVSWDDMIYDMIRYMIDDMICMIWYDICYEIWYDIWYMIRYMMYDMIHDLWYDMIWYGIWYDM